MENSKSKQSKVITNCSTQWQMEGSKGKKPQTDKTSYASRLHIYTRGIATFCPLEASPFSFCKHLIYSWIINNNPELPPFYPRSTTAVNGSFESARSMHWARALGYKI